MSFAELGRFHDRLIDNALVFLLHRDGGGGEKMSQITLGTFNIGRAATRFLEEGYSAQQVEDQLGHIADLINRHGIDVLGLQEVDVNTGRSRQINEPSWLRSRLGWPTGGSQFQPSFEFDGGQYGNAVLVNLSRPDLSYKNEKTQRQCFPPVLFQVEPASALAIRVDLKLPDSSAREYKNLWFVTTHLSLKNLERQNQIYQILKWVDTFSFPTLVCGDFNIAERSGGSETVFYQLLKEIMEEFGFIDLGPFGDSNFTFPRNASRRLDYMFLRDDRDWFTVADIKLIKPKTGAVWFSDHWMVACALSYT